MDLFEIRLSKIIRKSDTLVKRALVINTCLAIRSKPSNIILSHKFAYFA